MFQQLGAYVENVGNCTDIFLTKFYDVGGRWIAVKLYEQAENDPVAHANLAAFDRGWGDHARQLGIRPALWSNFRNDPNQYAKVNNELFRRFHLIGMVLDIEAEAKSDNTEQPGTPESRYALLSQIMRAQRALNPRAMIGVSSYGKPVYTMDWYSVAQNKVRYMPQWYYRFDGAYDPSECIKEWKRLKIGPVSYIHGALSHLEGHDLFDGVRRLRAARAQGFTYGFQVYTLESMNLDRDFAALFSARDLFLV
jgi:hypothetical protein